MKWAVGFLVVSCLVTVAGVGLVVLRINSGLVDPSIDSQRTGAFGGENAATPTGDDLPINRSVAAATITAAARFATALAGTAQAVNTPLADATPAAGEIVPIGQPVDVGGRRFTVHQVLDPEPPGLFKTDEGKRRVAIEITQEAVGGAQQAHFAHFKLRDSTGALHGWAITNGKPDFSVASLKAGDKRTGWISFQVPEGVALDALIYDNLTDRQPRAIVDLR